MWPFAECRLKSNLQKSILAQTFSFNHHIPKANTLLEKVLLKKIFNLWSCRHFLDYCHNQDKSILVHRESGEKVPRFCSNWSVFRPLYKVCHLFLNTLWSICYQRVSELHHDFDWHGTIAEQNLEMARPYEFRFLLLFHIFIRNLERQMYWHSKAKIVSKPLLQNRISSLYKAVCYLQL